MKMVLTKPLFVQDPEGYLWVLDDSGIAICWLLAERPAFDHEVRRTVIGISQAYLQDDDLVAYLGFVHSRPHPGFSWDEWLRDQQPTTKEN